MLDPDFFDTRRQFACFFFDKSRPIASGKPLFSKKNHIFLVFCLASPKGFSNTELSCYSFYFSPCST